MENFGIDSMAFIYCHTNKINGKKYIGQTCRTPRERWKNGFGYKGSTYFYSAIQKYGWNNFDHEILCVVPESFADTMEKYFIAKYNSNNHVYGYNLDSGGNLQKHRNEETIRKMSEANKGKHLSLETRAKISKSEKCRIISEKTLKPLYDHINKLKKSVILLETGQIYNSISDAAKSLNIRRELIRDCCKHRNNSTHGLHFEHYLSYYNDETHRISRIQEIEHSTKLKSEHSKPKLVICLDTDKIYDSIREASKELHIDKKSISNCCKHRKRYKSAGGLHFEFYNIKEAN